jgi:hypothetical protein
VSNADTVMLEAEDANGLNQQVVLITQPSHHIPGFIFGNSLCRRCRCAPAPLGCECPEPDHLPVFPWSDEGSRAGEDVLICGAGPSLAEVGAALEDHDGEVWGCNSALNYLVEHSHRVTHGVAIDPSTRMFGEVWKDPPAVDYILATTVNPGLTDHVHDAGHGITQFHSMRVCPDEVELYGLLYPKTVLTGHGLNVVNRALDLAGWLGFHVKIIGADSALVDGQMYADGRGMYEGDWTLEGTFDGRLWRTKADMLMSAVELVRHRNRLGADRVEFLGDTLPRALQDKPDEFLTRCIDWIPNE